MKHFFVIILISIFTAPVFGQSLKKIEANRIHLPNGWNITPVGQSVRIGDLPLNMAVSPNKKLLAVTNNGQSDQTIDLIDALHFKVLDTIVTSKSWMGLCFSADNNYLFASGGNDNWIMRYRIGHNKIIPVDTFMLGKPWPEKISPAGLAVDREMKYLYVVTKENNALYVIDIPSKIIIKQIPIDGEGYTCLLSPDQNSLYISCWGCSKILIYNTIKQKLETSIPIGSNPNDMCLSKDGTWLYVANSNDNSASAINTRDNNLVETLNAALYPNALEGSTSNSVALSEDEKTLYIANADNNCLAVFDVSNPGSSKSKGYIPTGWYPTCVRAVHGNLFVTNGKGFSSFPDANGPNPARKRAQVNYQKGDTKKPVKEQYIGSMFRGALSIIPEPDAKQLSIYSQVVYHNTPYNKDSELVAKGSPGNPVPTVVGAASPIRYVFYIIKENRTYDQVLGDLPGGNGDTSLVLFGNKITPNQHALAKEFVLLDNFYCDGEVSADGHNWSMGAYADDYLEKTWPTIYGGRGGTYGAEGGLKIANNKVGFLWDICKNKGISYRSYGEFIEDHKAGLPALEKHFCYGFTSWDQSVYDTTRFRQWKKDFDSLLAINALPQFNSIRFINDHTMGVRTGKPTPFAQVADNDLAVGLFVDYLSHSTIWNQSVVFIVEDDAQNGPDHVDAHRTTAYVAGGFVKSSYVDHTMYSTSSMLRTIELILKLPPMSQYDAAATPMWRCFSDSATHKPFTVKEERINLKELSMVKNKWSNMSDQFDFSAEDRTPDQELNKVIWVSVKGENILMPAPKHAAFISALSAKD